MEKEAKVGGRDVSFFEGVGGDHEFICAICQCFPFVAKEVLPCSHMFCESCIESWLSRLLSKVFNSLT